MRQFESLNDFIKEKEGVPYIDHRELSSEQQKAFIFFWETCYRNDYSVFLQQNSHIHIAIPTDELIRSAVMYFDDEQE